MGILREHVCGPSRLELQMLMCRSFEHWIRGTERGLRGRLDIGAAAVATLAFGCFPGRTGTGSDYFTATCGRCQQQAGQPTNSTTQDRIDRPPVLQLVSGAAD